MSQTEQKDFTEFYYFKSQLNAWNTRSKVEAQLKTIESGNKFKVSKIKLNKFNYISEKYNFNEVDFLSIDVEGLDLEI